MYVDLLLTQITACQYASGSDSGSCFCNRGCGNHAAWSWQPTRKSVALRAPRQIQHEVLAGGFASSLSYSPQAVRTVDTSDVTEVEVLVNEIERQEQ
jgi:hypothetical protein